MAPTVDDDGLLRYRGRWVTLSPVERALAAALIDRFNAVVGRDTLVRRAWPGGSPTRNALDVHMLRLRRRISTLGLEVRTVRARGYLLQALEPNGLTLMDVTDVLLDILIVLVAAKVAAEIAERINVPAVVGEIVAGVHHRPVGPRPGRRRRDPRTCSASSA